MSTHSKVESAALNDVKSLTAGVVEFLPQLIEAQEHGAKVEVTYDPNAKTVRMHGSERTSCNRGTINFSDSQYNIGINEDENGNVTLDYDSWVSSNKLGKRIKGKSQKEPANFKVCQSYWKAKGDARRRGQNMRVGVVDGQLAAFVPAQA